MSCKDETKWNKLSISSVKPKLPKSEENQKCLVCFYQCSSLKNQIHALPTEANCNYSMNSESSNRASSSITYQ